MERLTIEYSHPVWGSVAVVAEFDPSLRTARKILEASEAGMARGVCHGGTVVVFDAWTATHATVREALGYPASHLDADGTDFWIVRDGEEPFSSDWSASDDDPVRDGLRLLPGRNVEALSCSKLGESFFDLDGPAAP